MAATADGGGDHCLDSDKEGLGGRLGHSMSLLPDPVLLRVVSATQPGKRSGAAAASPGPLPAGAPAFQPLRSPPSQPRTHHHSPALPPTSERSRLSREILIMWSTSPGDRKEGSSICGNAQPQGGAARHFEEEKAIVAWRRAPPAGARGDVSVADPQRHAPSCQQQRATGPSCHDGRCPRPHGMRASRRRGRPRLRQSPPTTRGFSRLSTCTMGWPAA